jgi:hypothetical protein
MTKRDLPSEDDVPENLFVASDADEDALLGSKTEGLIL